MIDQYPTIPSMDSSTPRLDLDFDAHDFPTNLFDLNDVPSSDPSSMVTTSHLPFSACSGLGGVVPFPSTTLPSTPLCNNCSVACVPGSHQAPAAAPPSQRSAAAHNKARYHCTYPGCPRSYTRHPDMRRHASSHNANAVMMFCPHSGCRRRIRGFLRKDKLTAHLKAVHGG